MANKMYFKNKPLNIILLIVVLLGLFFIFSNLMKNTSSDWPSANQNFSNTREAVSSSINSGNVSTLSIAWTLPINGISEWGAATTNPLIIGNTVYFQDLKSNVYAVDFTSGKLLWSKDYNLDISGPSGIAVDDDKIFAVKGHYEIVALDLSGKELWTANLSNNQNIGIDIQPTAANGMVYVSTVPGISNENFYKGGAFGVIYALDQKTGKVAWSFDTVDSKDIWGNAKVNSGGGAWYPPAVDGKNSLYWGIGNPAPWPGTAQFPNGTSRPGNNLYTSSMVSLDAKTGKLNWYNQVSPHDLFDYDFEASPILATLVVNGQSRNVVFGAGKMGKVAAFDKKSGDKLWETNVGLHMNDNLKALPKGTTMVAPSPLGGVETCMAYSDGMLYVPVVDMAVQYTPSSFVSTSFSIGKGKGEIVAIDASNGKIQWKNNLDAVNVGAATVVSDLVFTSTFDGKIYAFDKMTGKEMWEYQANGGINGWPAVKGDTIIFPVGMGKSPVLMAFKLGAVSQPATISTTPTIGSGKNFQQ